MITLSHIFRTLAGEHENNRSKRQYPSVAIASRQSSQNKITIVASGMMIARA
ncbi:hypothetical protein ECZU43_33050 [Escherichia coli]|nr:hypothetical protein ECZU43_33050 [Escherichia coli]